MSRVLAAVLCVVGLAFGSLSDEPQTQTPVRSGEFWILRGDFHVHAFPGDGSQTPWALRGEAVRAGLDVIAITNHNLVATGQLAQRIAAGSDGPMMIGGEEITNPQYHLIAVGLSRLVDANQPVVAAIAAIHAQNAVAIAAHPTPSFKGWDDAAFAILDGTEVAHPAADDGERREFVETFERARRLNSHVAPIGSSDIHITPEMGACRTFVFARERSIAGVLEAIRAGRTVAVDENGTLHGDPDLVARVREAAPPGRSDQYRTVRRLGVILTWLGLLGVLLIGTRRFPS
jgi:predicted metal-dependent phosphoesterase TrpH